MGGALTPPKIVAYFVLLRNSFKPLCQKLNKSFRKAAFSYENVSQGLKHVLLYLIYINL